MRDVRMSGLPCPSFFVIIADMSTLPLLSSNYKPRDALLCALLLRCVLLPVQTTHYITSPGVSLEVVSGLHFSFLLVRPIQFTSLLCYKPALSDHRRDMLALEDILPRIITSPRLFIPFYSILSCPVGLTCIIFHRFLFLLYVFHRDNLSLYCNCHFIL